MVGVTVLGSTGTIGVSTLDVIARHRDQVPVVALAARSDQARLFEQCMQHRPRFAVLVDESAALALRARLAAAGCKTEVLCGAAALEQVAGHADTDAVMAGHRRRSGLTVNARRRARGQAAAARQTRKRSSWRASLLIEAVAGERRHADTDRQRAQRDLPVPAGVDCERTPRARNPPNHTYGIGRPVRRTQRATSSSTRRLPRRARIRAG